MGEKGQRKVWRYQRGTRCRKSKKNIKCNFHEKNNQRTNNDPQNTTQKTDDWATPILLIIGCESRSSGRVGNLCRYVCIICITCLFLTLQIEKKKINSSYHSVDEDQQRKSKSTKQKKAETAMVNNSININKTKEILKCCSTIPPISTK